MNAPGHPTHPADIANAGAGADAAAGAGSDKDLLRIGKREFSSRLLIGTGKYRDFDETRRAVEASGAQIVTVAIRRTNIGQNAGEPSLLDFLPPDRYTLLPNTAGCYTADEAVRTARLAREAGLSNWIKLEVIGDERTLFPDNEALLEATRTLVKEGFVVLPYTSDDPIACRVLGAMLVDGVGVARDHKRGQELLTRACDRKDAEACRLVKIAAEPAAADGGVPGSLSDAGLPTTTGDAGSFDAPSKTQ